MVLYVSEPCIDCQAITAEGCPACGVPLCSECYEEHACDYRARQVFACEMRGGEL